MALLSLPTSLSLQWVSVEIPVQFSSFGHSRLFWSALNKLRFRGQLEDWVVYNEEYAAVTFHKVFLLYFLAVESILNATSNSSVRLQVLQ